MDYRKFEIYYIRLDRDDEILSSVLKICRKASLLQYLAALVAAAKQKFRHSFHKLELLK